MATLTGLGEIKVPDIFASLQAKGLLETCSIQTNTATRSSSGGSIKGASSDAYTSVPCYYKPIRDGVRIIEGGKTVSKQRYLLTMPVYQEDGTRIDFDIKTHRIVVDSRGGEPQKTFLAESVGDRQGLLFEIICTKEN